MKLAMVRGPDDLRLEEVPEPQPGPDDVLVRVAACGICGSDLSYVAMGGLAGPMPLGHELSGVVERVGERVTSVAPGQHVVVNPMAGGNNIGNGGPEGGLAPLLLVRGAARDAAVLPIPAHVPLARAALAEPLAVALHAVNRAEVCATDRVVVYGAGPIGLGIIYWLKQRGVADVVAVDLSEKRLALAARFGASTTVNPPERAVGDVLAERHGRGTVFGWPVVETDVYIDAAGASAVIGDVINLARAGARLVVVALHKQPVAVDFRLVLAKELTISAAIGYPVEFPEVIATLSTADNTLNALISHRIEWPDLARAFTAAQDPAHALKVMVTFPG
jgi:2-desacetyl-2-hydroxyethyl bacteriochlorophyllide A dehydrogenase